MVNKLVNKLVVKKLVAGQWWFTVAGYQAVSNGNNDSQTLIHIPTDQWEQQVYRLLQLLAVYSPLV